MELREVSLPSLNKFASDYVRENENLRHFFDYPNLNHQSYIDRQHELSSRQFPRENLRDYLMNFHKKFDVSIETLKNIDRLRNSNSVVVIGGQQAGLLTGPLYTIHKVISILKLAKKQEEQLGVPVLPLFWVAGEDHDFEEINHVYSYKGNKVKKHSIKDRQLKKGSASNITLDKDKCKEWIDELFESYGEGEFTKKTIEKIYHCIEQSNTYVDFFIRIIYLIFPNEGLIVLDSGDEQLRKIESPFFTQMIKNNSSLSEKVYKQQLALKEAGYGTPVDLNERNAHIFYHLNGERILLQRNDCLFSGKNEEITLTLEQLLNIAETTPEALSNNVVTRPLMQEYLFPTLAFVAGPGEIKYWATLKNAFHLFGFKVPLLVPRIAVTIVERHINSYLKETQLPLVSAITSGAQNQKETWLNKQDKYLIEEQVELALSKIDEIHKPLQELSIKIDPALSNLAEKNNRIIQDQIKFLQRKMMESFYSQHKTIIRKYDHIDISLKPNGHPQERIWNIFYYLNKYGFSFVENLHQLEWDFNSEHKVIYI